MPTSAAGRRGLPGRWDTAGLGYLTLIAPAAEQLGVEAGLTLTGTWCEGAWLAAVAPAQRLTFLVAFRPGLLSPVLAGRVAAGASASPAEKRRDRGLAEREGRGVRAVRVGGAGPPASHRRGLWFVPGSGSASGSRLAPAPAWAPTREDLAARGRCARA